MTLIPILFVVAVTAIAEEERHSVGDCGPRAVQAVLRHFGRDLDLSSLISEMQARGQADCSFGDIKAALEQRGMRVLAIAPGKYTRLVGASPIIVHLENDRDVGHFAVLKRIDGQIDRVVIDGNDGTALHGSWQDALSICTREMLVVSDQDIAIDQLIVPANANAPRFVLGVGVVSLISLLCWLFVSVFHFRSRK